MSFAWLAGRHGGNVAMGEQLRRQVSRALMAPRVNGTNNWGGEGGLWADGLPDGVARDGQGARWPEWPGCQVARVQRCQVARWPGGQVARWQGGKVARWQGGQGAR